MRNTDLGNYFGAGSHLRSRGDFMISSPLMSRSHDQWDPASRQAKHSQAALKVVRTG